MHRILASNSTVILKYHDFNLEHLWLFIFLKKLSLLIVTIDFYQFDCWNALYCTACHILVF